MLYCDEYDKNCREVTSEECDNGCCDSCMYCVICTDEECFLNMHHMDSLEKKLKII